MYFEAGLVTENPFYPFSLRFGNKALLQLAPGAKEDTANCRKFPKTCLYTAG